MAVQVIYNCSPFVSVSLMRENMRGLRENLKHKIRTLAPDDDYGDEVEEMGASLKLIKERITKSKHLQEQIRAHEFRDRSIAERNFERINFWSLIQVIVMIVAGLSQVLMIRSIFDEKSPVRKILFSK